MCSGTRNRAYPTHPWKSPAGCTTYESITGKPRNSQVLLFPKKSNVPLEEKSSDVTAFECSSSNTACSWSLDCSERRKRRAMRGKNGENTHQKQRSKKMAIVLTNNSRLEGFAVM